MEEEEEEEKRVEEEEEKGDRSWVKAISNCTGWKN